MLHGEDLIQDLHTWNGADWQVSNTDAAPARLNRLCSADLPPVSAFYNPASGNGYEGRLFMDGEEGGTGGRPFGHVVATGDSYELTPWLGNMSYENVVARADSGDATVVMGLDDGDATVGQQVHLYRGTKTDTGNPVQKAGLTNGTLYGVKVVGVPNEYLESWTVGEQHDIELVDVSQFAGVGGPGPNTLDGDSQAKLVTNFQRPEDGSWDPQHPNDFYFVTTSSFGPRPDENRTGETRLWRLRFVDPTDPSQGGTITLLVNGPVGTADSPSATGTQSAGSRRLDLRHPERQSPRDRRARPRPVHTRRRRLPDQGRGDVGHHPGSVPRRELVPARRAGPLLDQRRARPRRAAARAAHPPGQVKKNDAAGRAHRPARARPRAIVRNGARRAGLRRRAPTTIPTA